LQTSTSALCQLEAATLRAQCELRIQNTLDTLRIAGHVVTPVIEHAHMVMLARWRALFPPIRFDHNDPGSLQKYVH
jgi:hypothetical protein